MTILYVHKTIMTCGKCSEDFVFPRHLSCPTCAEPIEFRSAEEFEPHAQTLSGQPALDPHPKGKGHEPDGFAKQLVYVGLALSAAMLACSYWHGSALDPFLAYVNLPSAAWPFVRYLLFFAGGFGIAQGIASLVFWKSGTRYYRRFHFF